MNRADADEFHKEFYGCEVIDIGMSELDELITQDCVVSGVSYEFSVEIKLNEEVKEYLKKCINKMNGLISNGKT